MGEIEAVTDLSRTFLDLEVTMAEQFGVGSYIVERRAQDYDVTTGQVGELAVIASNVLAHCPIAYDKRAMPGDSAVPGATGIVHLPADGLTFVPAVGDVITYREKKHSVLAVHAHDVAGVTTSYVLAIGGGA